MVQRFFNMNIVEEIKKIIVKASESLSLSIDEKDIRIEHPAEVKFGDYSTNVAMVLAKKEKINPRELAEKIKTEIENNNKEDSFVKKIEIAGPGFVNFYLKEEFLIKEAEKINYEVEFRNELSKFGQGKTVVIDYSAPNIAKPFGIGHLRSTNIGQAIYNSYKILGWTCIGDNHIGDWGTQFGKLITAIKKWNDKEIDQLSIDDLEKLYVKFHKEAEKDKSLIEEGREWFAKLERKDKEARDIWQKCVDISLLEFERVYQLLGVHIDFIHGESFYADELESIIKEIDEKGISKKSQGATIVDFKDMTPAMLTKTNGTTTYFTRDMATIKYRLEKWQPDLIVYEVGADQNLHFKQLFKTAEMMGWLEKTEMIHIGHGLIRWKDGKFSTRKGNTIHLSDVIDKAMEKAEKIADKSSVSKELKASEKEKMIKAVAIGAIKFNDLISDPKKDIIFDWDQIMNLNGDSGPYLQYTYARCGSVLNKSQVKEQKNIEKMPEKIEKEEMALIKELYRFKEKIEESAKRFSPAVLADYLLSVARKYNEFYAKNRIINEKEEVFRIFLTKTVTSILNIGLEILGVDRIEKM